MTTRRQRKKKKGRSNSPQAKKEPNGHTVDLDKIFCMNAKRYRLEKLLLKAVAMVESSLKVRAYRFEPAFFDRYLAKKDEWKTRDPNEVSASYGLMQIMFTTAHSLGFRGTAEELYNPVYNIGLGAKLLRQNMDGKKDTTNTALWPMDIALARYNGGWKGNPGDDGTLRNQSYVDKVKTAYWKLRGEEEDCD